jgi:hypothetical protein
VVHSYKTHQTKNNNICKSFCNDNVLQNDETREGLMMGKTLRAREHENERSLLLYNPSTRIDIEV